MAEGIPQSERLGDRLERMDQEIRAWAKLTRGELVKSVLSLNLHEQIRFDGEDNVLKPLKKDIRYGLRKKQGDTEGVAFRFPRHGIFLERGVGKYRKANSSAANRAARPWLYPVLDGAFDDLADLIEQGYGDIAASELRILIPGIIDKTTEGIDTIEVSDEAGTYKILIDKSFF